MASMGSFRAAAFVAGVLGSLGFGFAGPASAKLVDSFQQWSTHVDGEGEDRVCWVLSRPLKWTASRKNVRRGEIQLAVSYRPAEGVSDEVSFSAGYPLAEDSRVTLSVGDQKFEFFTRGENAWPQSAADDTVIVDAFRKGTAATVRGQSTRGTRTTDTFSLIGFTAALDHAARSCAK